MGEAYLEYSRDGHQQTAAIRSHRFALGRASSNDLGFPEDHAVSGQHAVIEQQADGWLIRDLNSTNGTTVNGQKISGPQMIRSGDSIQLGQTRLAFRVVRQGQGPEPAAPPSGYLDATDEWSRPVTPPVSSLSGRPSQDQAGWQRPQPPETGLGQTSTGDSARHAAAKRETRRPKRGHDQIRGNARNVHVAGLNDRTVLSFRIERYDAVGNRLPPVGTEFIGYQSGQVNDGDDVDVYGRWSRGTLRAKRINNISTGAQIRGMSGTSKVALGIVYTLVCAFIVGIVIAIVL